METFTYFWSVSWLMWVIKLFSFSQKNLMKKGQRRAPKSHRERASHFLPARLVVYSTGPGALGGHPLVDSSQLVTTQEAHGGYSPRDDNRFSQTQNVSHTQDPKSNPPWDPWLLCQSERQTFGWNSCRLLRRFDWIPKVQGKITAARFQAKK